MGRAGSVAVLVAMVVVAIAVRLNNALVFPVLGGNDAFAHFTYIWFLAETGNVPLPHTGWEFFQPPLYYALMAALWNGLHSFDAESRLRAGTVAIALLGLAPAVVALAISRTAFPRDHLAAVFATGLMLFLPVHLYSAGFVGNEGLHLAVGALAFGSLMWVLARMSVSAAAVLGLLLGLAMLTKYTAVVLVGAAFSTIALKSLAQGNPWRGARVLLTVAVVMLAVCGSTYARNVSLYGNPFPLSREQLFLARVENSQLQGERRFLEYVLFDPLILYRPQWPRGLSLNSPRPPGTPYSAMRESIPTGLYANAWFDGFGGFALPPVVHSEASRRFGQLLLTLGLLPTALIAVGLVVSVCRLRRGWDDASVAALTALAAMTAVLVVGTLSVPTQAAVKATYLMTVSVPFAVLLATGTHELARLRPRWRNGLVAACAVLAVASVLAFSYGRVIDDAWFRDALATARVRNLYGVLHWAGGDRDVAEREFEMAARSGWHLGYENLATAAYERGDLDRAIYLLSAAAIRQPRQVPGSAAERAQAIAVTEAEYGNSLGVMLHAAGRAAEARRAFEKALRSDPAIPEILFDLGVLDLEEAIGGQPGRGGRPTDRLGSARAAFERSLALDPAFVEASMMLGVTDALLGDCGAAGARISPNLALERRPLRAWPVPTGPGDLNAAGLDRRRHIERMSERLDPATALRRCGELDRSAVHGVRDGEPVP